MDNTVRMWDVRPYVSNGSRMVRMFTGVSHNFEKNLLRCGWNGDDSLVTAGSADRTVNIWEADTGKLKHRLGGHSGSVNDVQLHPTRSLVASCSSDSTVCLGEI